VTTVNEAAVFGDVCSSVPVIPAVPVVVRWQSWFVPTVVGLDFVAAVVGMVAAGVVLGHGREWLTWVSAAGFAVVWVLLVGANRGYESRLLGTGPEEFRSLSRAAVVAWALLGVGLVVTDYRSIGGRLVAAVLITVVVDAGARYVLRKDLHRRRNHHGEAMQKVLAVGRADGVTLLIDQLSRDMTHGLQVVGACLSSNWDGAVTRVGTVPVEGGVDQVMDVVRRTRPDAVAIASHPDFSGMALRKLSWDLDDLGVELILVPGVIEVAGPRLSVRPAAGLSLLRVERPSASSRRLVGKRLYDLALGGAVLVVALVPIAVIAALIKVTSRGPAFFVQRRVGEDGRVFPIVKFRTMVVDAEQQLIDLTDSNESDGLLFKMKNDPRVTKVGAVLRRLSLDELPQLFNVIRGDMSLVGPRPPLPSEVEQYDGVVVRRLRVKPGMTGLWQVSGRSDLTWEESVLLDLRYVDNWSPALDMMILWKTVRAVLAPRGAY
jgi:exopolysaccharide biosynthesis polyprenyl glycosylphosphotransferase